MFCCFLVIYIRIARHYKVRYYEKKIKFIQKHNQSLCLIINVNTEGFHLDSTFRRFLVLTFYYFWNATSTTTVNIFLQILIRMSV